MIRRCLGLLALASVAAGGAAAFAEVGTAATQTAAPGPRAAQPAPTTTRAADAKDRGKDDADEAVPKALIDAAKQSFVVVKFWYKKDLTEPTAGASDDWRIRQIYEEFIENKYPEERPGVVLDDKGHVLVYDDGLEDRFLDRIEVEEVGGSTFPASRARLLFDATAVVLKVDAEAAGKLRGLKFSDLKDEGVNTTVLQAALYQSDDQWRVRFSPLRPAVGYSPGEPGNVFYGFRVPSSYERLGGASARGRPVVLADEDGRAVGVCADSFMDLRQKEALWKGPDLLGAGGISWAKLKASEADLRKKLTAAAHEVVIAFHQGSRGGEYGPSEPSFTGRPGRPRVAAGREITVYGVAISPTQILVPLRLNSKVAAEIDKISVKFSPWSRKPADFVGAFKDFGAFVIKLRTGALPAQVALAEQDLVRMRPFWVARARKKFGSKYVDLTWNRIHGKARGYAGKYHWAAAREIKEGSLLVDFAGRVAGMCLHQRVEDEEQRQLERTRSYYGAPRDARIFTISELREALTGPLAHLDAKIQVKTRIEAKRRAWFGVEFVLINSDLAEQLKVEVPTKDGQLGFVVNGVYPGSPAERLGIKVGDILMRIQAPRRPYPIELNGELAGGGDRFGMEQDWRFSGPSMQAMRPAWQGRGNGLTRALDAIGIGEKVAISYCRSEGEAAGKTATLEYQIEQAPPDFDSAPKWKNRKIGLTVKDLTYEIRMALRLKPADPGVIVANVEDGSPMDTARIFANEIIIRLDDQPLTSARQMRQMVAAAKQAGKDKVRLTIFRLGKTRFADLTIKTYSPADDEGLDEEEGGVGAPGG